MLLLTGNITHSFLLHFLQAILSVKMQYKECPLKIPYMEKIKITDNSVIEQIRDNMATATISEKGLMPAGLIGSKNNQSSTLICETTTNAVTGSLLLAVSATTSGIPNLYFITMGRSANSTNNPTLRVKVLAGTYDIKIIGKTDANGVCRIYAERNQYTPVLKVISMNTIGITMKMESADNSDFENGFEASLI